MAVHPVSLFQRPRANPMTFLPLHFTLQLDAFSAAHRYIHACAIAVPQIFTHNALPGISVTLHTFDAAVIYIDHGTAFHHAANTTEVAPLL